MTRDQPLPAVLDNRDKARLAAYRSNLLFYSGEQWQSRPRRNDRVRRLTMNYARAMVTKVATFTGGPHSVQVIPDQPTAEARASAEAAEQAITAASAANDTNRLDYDTEVDCSVLGDAAYKVTWLPDENRPVITAPDMQDVFPWHLPHDLHTFYRVAHRYQLPASDAAQIWGVTPQKDPATIIEDWTADTLEIWVDRTRASAGPNPQRPHIPFVIFPNETAPKQWWGTSDIEPIREPCAELNAQISRLSNILELSGNPIAVLANVDESADIAAVPGAVWTIPEDAKAYLLDLLSGGGVRLHMEYIAHLMNTLHDLSEVPRAAFAGTDRNLSGVALQIELRPLTQKVARKRAIRAAAYARRAELVLALLDAHTGTSHAASGRITVAGFDPVIPDDANIAVRREADTVAASLSSHTAAMARLGVDDPPSEWSRLLAEAGQLTAPAATAATAAAHSARAQPPEPPRSAG